MSPFSHFLLTRFNVRPGPEDTAIVADSDYLRQRWDLFERFCAPSVRAQTERHFTWLVFFDVSTPTWMRAHIERYAAGSLLVPVYVTDLRPSTVSHAIRSRLTPCASHIITTRLDNDDAICDGFVRMVQSVFRGQAFEFVNFTHGYVWYRGRVYLHADASNAFASLIESASGFRTIWCRQHTRLSEAGPVRQIADIPAWLQVVHQTNLSNRIRGERVARQVLRGRFTITVSELEEDDGALSLWIDRNVLCRLRSLRELFIRGVKCVHARPGPR